MTTCSNCAAYRARAIKAETELAELRAQRGKLHAKTPSTEDGKLIESVRVKLGTTRTELAKRLGLADSTMLSQAHSAEKPKALPERIRALLRDMLEDEHGPGYDVDRDAYGTGQPDHPVPHLEERPSKARGKSKKL